MASQTLSPGTGASNGQTILKNTSGTTSEWFCSNFGFSIPSGSIIKGIQCDLQEKLTNDTANSTATNHIALTKTAGVDTGTSKFPTGTTYSGSFIDNDGVQGSSSDLWGTTWSVSDINATGFGFGIDANYDTIGNSANSILTFAFKTITVYYTPPLAGAGTLMMMGV
jgi:hypothetical protein